MAKRLEFPLRPEAQVMTIEMASVLYTVRFGWADTPDGGWFMDLGTYEGTPLIRGLPLTAGENILQQFDYLGIGGEIRVETDGNALVEPTYGNLGSNGKVFFITP